MGKNQDQVPSLPQSWVGYGFVRQTQMYRRNKIVIQSEDVLYTVMRQRQQNIAPFQPEI